MVFITYVDTLNILVDPFTKRLAPRLHSKHVRNMDLLNSFVRNTL